MYRNAPRIAAAILLLFLSWGCATLQTADKILADCPGITKHALAVDTFLVIGHRGAAAKAAENTIRSMEVALEDGANALEIDLCMTSDGHVILWHDWDPNSPISLAREQGREPNVRYRPVFPPAGALRRPVSRLTLAEFRKHHGYVEKDTSSSRPLVSVPLTAKAQAEIPTFVEFVRWAATKPGLRYVFLDMKVPPEDSALAGTMTRRMDSILVVHRPAFRAVYLTPYESIYAIIERSISATNLSFDVDLPGGAVPEPCTISSARFAQSRGKGFASTVHPFTTTVLPWTTLKRLIECDVRLRDASRERGEAPLIEKVIAATINDEDKMECLIGLGVDGLITDDPARLRRVALRLGKRVE